MRSVDAACVVLREAGKPLHYTDVARLVIERGLGATSGKTVERTINHDMNQEILQRGSEARFVRFGQGMFAAAPAPDSISREAKAISPTDLAYVVDAWGHMPPDAKEKVLQVVSDSLAKNPQVVDDPIFTSLLPQGPKCFPCDFLNGKLADKRTISLPNEDIEIQSSPAGAWHVSSHFGFRLSVRNETEGRYIVYAHKAGEREVTLPGEMIHVFKAVKTYESYLNQLWHELYRKYGKKTGSRETARRHADAAFRLVGLPLTPVDRPTTVRQDTPGPPQRPIAKETHRMISSWALAAAFLLKEGRKLHYNEITDRVLKTGLTRLGRRGKTPDMSMNGILTTTTRDGSKLFISEGGGEYSLRDKLFAGSIPDVKVALALISSPNNDKATPPSPE